jgi:septal ring factor EnvC (AmiA/AmiB activator)
MTYQPVVFNENALRNVVKETSKAELEKHLKDLKFEMKRMWDFLNSIREDISTLNMKIDRLEKFKVY